ncbi:MAG: hypothetical protein ACK4UP_11835 [Spirosomataceae bacterium]
MKIVSIGQDKKLIQAFHDFAVSVYKGNPYWIQPIRADIDKLFDESKNVLFKEGAEATRVLAYNEEGEIVARVAVFINPRTTHRSNDQPTGGIGFFECINDKDVAFQVFDFAKNWLQERGMEAMDGPINFGERDNWWGLLVDPFDLQPSWGMPYHQPYYRTFFEEYGFQNYFEQYTYWLPIPEVEAKKYVRPALFERANRIYDAPGYHFEHVDKKNLDKYAHDFRVIYNKAWAKNLSTGEMSENRAKAIMKMFKPIMEPELMWFGYYEGEPIAFFIMIPDLNQVFKYVNGKMDWKGKLIFLYHQWMKTNKKARGVIFGVIPEFQGRGVESAIALAFSQVCWTPNYQYEELELNWIGDFNPKMLAIVGILGAKKYKTYISYRYLFDRTKPFTRHPQL